MLYILDILFAAALVVAPLAWILDPLKIALGPAHLTVHWGWKPLLGPVLLFLFRVLAKRWFERRGKRTRGLCETGLFRKLSVAVASPFIFLLACELILKTAGFQAPLPPVLLRGGEKSAGTRKSVIIPDRELLWRFNPGVAIEGYAISAINSLGFAEREVDPEKKPGTKRVICFGDSVTAQGLPPYSGALHRLLTNAPPTAESWEAFNMAVIGYSSAQGLRLFERKRKQMQPDVVTILYGWNDHWLGDKPDSLRMGVRMNRVTGRVVNKLKQKRFFQFLVYAVNPVRNAARSKADGGLRVPHDEYRWIFEKFVAEVRAAGAVPILMTAPRARELDASLLEHKRARSVEEIVRVHDEYVAITREVAEECNAHLVDLAELFTGAASTNFFMRDGVHLTQEGLDRTAEELYRKIGELAREGG